MWRIIDVLIAITENMWYVTMHLLNAVDLHEFIVVCHFQMDSVGILYSQIDLI